MIKIFIYTLFICLTGLALMRWFERYNTFFPEKPYDKLPADYTWPYEEVLFKTPDNIRLHGWLFPEKSSDTVLIFAHGNAGNISHRLDKINVLRGLGIAVFIFDYRGYGKSDGRPSERGIYRDMEGAVTYIKSRRDFSFKKFIFYGESLGGAAVIDFLYKHPDYEKNSMLILEGTFTSATDMAKIIYPFLPSFIVNTKLDNARKILRIKAPLLILHSINDPVVPYTFGEALYKTASGPKELITFRGDHCAAFAQEPDLYINSIGRFLGLHGTEKREEAL